MTGMTIGNASDQHVVAHGQRHQAFWCQEGDVVRETVDVATRYTEDERRPDVSVIVATYCGADRIALTLESLAAQTLEAERFEVIVVSNGPDDGTAAVVEGLRNYSFPAPLRMVRIAEPGAANARNLGVAIARGDYVTFVDDDDTVTPRYLEVLVEHASPSHVTIVPIADVEEPGQAHSNFNNYLNRATLRFAGRDVTFSQLSDAAAANGAKLIPARVARAHRYRTDLSSGEDVAFWAEVFAVQDLQIRVVPPASGAVYRRLVRESSISRSYSRTFADDRLAIIAHLEDLARANPSLDAPLRRLMAGQASNLGRYLREFPAERLPILDRIAEMATVDFPHARVNIETAEKLVVSYAFPPYLDTSAMVVARRLCLAREPVDVLTHSMDAIRKKDPLADLLVKESVGHLMTVGGPAVFANWNRISVFATRGNEMVQDHLTRRGRPYRSIYSRSMWPAAHVMAALFKVRNPNVRWVAEFSDPMHIDSEGNIRTSSIPQDDGVFEEVERAIRHRGLSATESRNMWEWVENTAYALADEIVFTNANQQRFMLDHAVYPEHAARAQSIARVDRHPTLPERFYHLEKSEYQLPAGRVNIGYFGVFYKVRGVGDLLEALSALTPQERSRVMLHVFTNAPEDTAAEVASRGLDDCVSVQQYLPYLEFLELTKHFDWLVVTDARVADVHGINPYLPSKYSDYVGSGAKIWAVVEPGSVLAGIPTDAKTELGDVAAARSVLLSLETASPMPA
ncbi:glycosyltransferase [Sanguibacter sp. A247]|uniref:glycosyltransferase n=1 Tax=unclassified Sanguibacter TaxID=2645534 RepID=UPI003FD8F782